MANSAKEHLTIYKAKLEEKVEKASARTVEVKKFAKERRKAKETKAKMELFQSKAKHAAHKLTSHHPPIPVAPYPTTHHHPLGITATMAKTTAPTYPLGGHPPAYNY